MTHGTCRECSKPTALSKRGKPLTYCSKYCANKRFVEAYRKRRPLTRNRQAEYHDRDCIVCGAAFRASRPTGKFCSDSCKGQHYSLTMRTKSKLPADHPVMALIAEAKAIALAEAEERRRERDRLRGRSDFAWRTARECPGCACMFTPLYTSTMICCSKRCVRRTTRWRRNAAEREAPGSFTWSQFMQVARRFGYCCAYCGDRPGQLDPDHVVPLSRGGINSTTNLLPSCRQCNGDKRDLLLSEWAVDREARGKPPRATNWAPEDRRYWHLTQALLAEVA